MIHDSKIQSLWKAAREVPLSDHVPFVFETRVMSALRASGGRDSAGWAFTGLWRAAAVSLAIAMLTTGLDLAVQDSGRDLGVEEALELALLPADVVEQDF